MIEELDQQLNPKKRGATRVNPESQLEDKSVSYSKLQLSGKITNADIADDAGIPASKTTLGTYTAPTAWTPTITFAGGSSPTDDGSGIYYYTQIGKSVTLWGHTGLIGGIPAQWQGTLPVAPNLTILGTNRGVASGNYYAVSGQTGYGATLVFYNGSVSRLFLEPADSSIDSGAWFSFSITYPAA